MLDADASQDKAELDLWEVIARIWRRRLVLVLFGCGGLIFGVYQLHTTSYLYMAEMSVVPASSSENSSVQSGGGLGALASLAGLGMRQSQTMPPYQLYLEAIYSFDAAERMMMHDKLVQRVFSGEWSASEGRWREPSSFYRRARDLVAPVLGLPPNEWVPPGPARMQEYLRSNIVVTTDDDSALASIRMEHTDPEFAVELLTILNREVDNMIRERTLERTEDYIQYLSRQLAAVRVAEHRLALAQSLGEQERFRMMASADVPYAADIFDGPSASPRPTSPRPLFVLVAGVIGGVLVAVPLVLLLGDRGIPARPRDESGR